MRRKDENFTVRYPASRCGGCQHGSPHWSPRLKPAKQTFVTGSGYFGIALFGCGDYFDFSSLEIAFSRSLTIRPAKLELALREKAPFEASSAHDLVIPIDQLHSRCGVVTRSAGRIRVLSVRISRVE